MTRFTARRLMTDGLSSVTRWFDGETPLCFALEPGFTRVPHPGIPAGSYSLVLNTAGQKSQDYAVYYGGRFGIGWHKGMVMLEGVPGRDAIEFHVGNTIADTLGCFLAGENVIAPPGNGSGHYEVERSRAAYERVYPILRDAILNGRATVEVIEMEAMG